MKNTFFFLLALAFCFTTSCDEDAIRPSDEITVVQHDITGFTSIQVETDIKLFFSNTTGPELFEVEANENLQNSINLQLDGNRLVIGIADNIRGNSTMNVRINTRNLITRFAAATDAEIEFITPLNQESVQISLFTDAKLTGEVNVDNLDMVVTTDANADIFGLVGSMEAELNTDGRIDGFGLEVQDLDIELNTDSDAELTVLNTLRARANTSATLRYRGEPDVLLQSSTTGGSIRRDN